MEYTIKLVVSKREMDDFVSLPKHIYKDCPCYVPDLDGDVRKLFDERRNPGLETSDIKAFVAYDEAGTCVGRIAGIVNHKANRTWGTRNVRFGMIEFIDDYAVSEALLQAVEQWGSEVILSRMGAPMEKIEGPLGITDFDKEGMLVESFDVEGSMIAIYNPEYYPRHMERLGFEKVVDWVQVRLDIPKETPARYQRAARLVSEMYDLKVKVLTHHEVLHEGYARKVFDLLNKAYKPLYGFSQLSEKQCDTFLHQYLPVLDLRMIPLVVDNEGQIVAVAITMAGLSDALKKSKGRLLPVGWLHLLKSLKFKKEGKVEMMLIAVDPDSQGLGVNALLFDYLIPVYQKLGYTWAETGPMLEDNLKVLTQWKPFNPTVYKRRRCYGKEIKSK